MELKSLDLNNTIVRFRKVVGQAKFRVTGKLIRRIRQLKKKIESESKEERKKQWAKKLERYLEDVHALKKLKPDDVSKFALLNTKTLQELKITGKTPASDRVLFKVATSEVLVSAIEEFREKYPEWHREVPFMLQRLGMQYKFRKGEREASDIKKLLKKMKLKDDDGEESDGSKPELAIGNESDKTTKPEGSLLEKVKSRRKEEKLASKKRREENLKKRSKSSMDAAVGEHKKKKDKVRQLKKDKKERRPKPTVTATSSSSSDPKEMKPVSIPEGRLGQMEIRRLRLDSDNNQKTEGQISSASSSRFDITHDRQSANDPFFVDKDVPQSGMKTLRDKATEKEKLPRKPVEKTMRMGGRDGREKEHSTKHRKSEAPGIEKKENSMGEKRKRRQEEPALAGKQESTDKESLHPSWEAKRKQKLLHQSLSTTVAKKIKFD